MKLAQTHSRRSGKGKVKRLLWLDENRGRLADIARRLGISGSFVSRVFAMRERSARVEEALALEGVPGFPRED